MNEVVIGVDGGTTAVEAVAFALDGSIVATHHERSRSTTAPRARPSRT